MENNTLPKNYKIVFTEDKFVILDEILKKYKMEGLDEKALAPGSSTPSPSIMILNAVGDITEGTIQANSLPELLKTNLNLSDADAKSLTEDIKTKLLPICKKVPTENKEKNNINISGSEIPTNKPIGTSPINTTPATPKRQPRIKKEIISEEVKKSIPPTTQPSGPDNYREPIE